MHERTYSLFPSPGFIYFALVPNFGFCTTLLVLFLGVYLFSVVVYLPIFLFAIRLRKHFFLFFASRQFVSFQLFLLFLSFFVVRYILARESCGAIDLRYFTIEYIELLIYWNCPFALAFAFAF